MHGTTYLVDIRSGTRHTASNGLDKAGDLAHDVDAVQSLAKGAVHLGGDVLAVGRLAVPGPLDGLGLGPLTLGILL